MTTTKTEYGPIRHGGSCFDHYRNIVEQDGRRLQAPAMRALREAERRLFKRKHPVRSKFPRNKNAREPIILTGSWRSCDLQRQLYASDSSRYADPDKTLHTRGLAIDVHTGHLDDDVLAVLRATGWKRSRPDDEPWHHSYWLTA